MTEAASALMDMRLLAAQAVAREAGAAARRRFLDQSFTVGFKGPQDFLTEVDGETEAFIAERLLQVFPTDGFIGEESRARPAGEKWRGSGHPGYRVNEPPLTGRSAAASSASRKCSSGPPGSRKGRP